jgi:hypothetical protein
LAAGTQALVMNALVSLTVIIVGCILAAGERSLRLPAHIVMQSLLLRALRGLGAAVLYVPDGNEVAPFRSPRKLARAIIHGAVIPVDGDTVVGKHVVVS